MPSLKQYNSLVVVIHRLLFDHLSATKMKIGKDPALLKKAASLCKSKTSVLTARLLVLVSLRRRMAMVGTISQRIHALTVSNREKDAKVNYHKALMLRKAEKPTYHGGKMANPSHHLVFFDQEVVVGCCPDWTLHPIISDGDDFSYTDEYGDDRDEPSVMNSMRSNQEAKGLEINVHDDIDQAAEMFIRKFCEQMNERFS